MNVLGVDLGGTKVAVATLHERARARQSELRVHGAVELARHSFRSCVR